MKAHMNTAHTLSARSPLVPLTRPFDVSVHACADAQKDEKTAELIEQLDDIQVRPPLQSRLFLFLCADFASPHTERRPSRITLRSRRLGAEPSRPISFKANSLHGQRMTLQLTFKARQLQP